MKNLILLTGAGFTYNFGGFLAREMWSKIFNNPLVQANKEIRELLQKDFDFESVYFEVTFGSKYNEQAKADLRKAVEGAYKDLDTTVKNYVFTGRNPMGVNIYGLGELFAFMSQRGSDKGWFFTLNQDLYMERKNGYRSPGALFPQVFNNGSEVGGQNMVQLPDQAGVDRAKSNLCNASYIKLHGSYGWTSSSGSTQMVIGKNKVEDINREPLLKWYLDLFQDAIYEGSKKLLIIGYGFGDEHINRILLKGVQDYNLSIYIINPTDPENVKKVLEGYQEGTYSVADTHAIWKGVRGYFPYSLRQIYPPDQSSTTMAMEIKKALES